MKLFITSFYVFLIVVCFTNCNQVSKDLTTSYNQDIGLKKPIIIDTVEVVKSELVLNQLEGKWYYKNKPYNGYALKFYPNGVLQERLGFSKGKRQGIAKRWSENGVLRMECFYDKNKLVGVYKSFWENGMIAEESHYVNGLKQGVEKQWHNNGQLSKLRNLTDGKEQGMQQAWLKNGTLYINYEAKNGRVFGLLRSNLCYQLKDEVVIIKKK